MARVNGDGVRRNGSNDENRSCVKDTKRQGASRARGIDDVKKDEGMEDAVSVRYVCVAKRNGSRF